MSTKYKFDQNSIRFRLWLYFLSLVIGIVALIWLLQVVFLNVGYEDMKVKEVDRIASSIYHSYIKNDENLTKNIQELSVSNDFYVMMESGGTLLMFTPEQENIFPVYRYQNQIPKLRAGLQKNKSASSPVYFKFSTTYEKYSTLAYGRYMDRAPGNEVTSVPRNLYGKHTQASASQCNNHHTDYRLHYDNLPFVENITADKEYYQCSQENG